MRNQAGTLTTLESLEGLAQDVADSRFKDAQSEGFDALIARRFGPNVSPSDVLEALDALRDLSNLKPA